MRQIHPIYRENEKQIKELCAPLAKHWDIHYFDYCVFYPHSRGTLVLSNNNHSLDAWIEKFPLVDFAIKPGWKLWGSHLDAQQIAFHEKDDIGKGIYCAIHDAHKIEVFSFASRPDNHDMYDFYLNNQRKLMQFFRYFKESINDEINIDSELLFKAPLDLVPASTSDGTTIDAQDDSDNTFLNELIYPFNLLSTREMDCFKLLIKGYSIAEIGRMLFLSPGTIDVYISRIKRKLNCDKKVELIEKGVDYKLIEYYLNFA